MKKFFLILAFFSLITGAFASTKKNIIKNLNETKNLAFNFEQNINGKLENGYCVIQFPKKINCKIKKF